MTRRVGRIWLLASLLCALLCPVAHADTVYLPLVGVRFLPFTVTWATVTEIVDGDTVWVDLDGDGAGDAKVRYLGIDTPEIHFGVECYGPEATEFNRRLVEGQAVALRREVSDVDRWGRLLRHVYLKWGYPDRTTHLTSGYLWVNGHLVRMGYARVTTYAPDDRYEAALEALQDAARAENVGGWEVCGW